MTKNGMKNKIITINILNKNVFKQRYNLEIYYHPEHNICFFNEKGNNLFSSSNEKSVPEWLLSHWQKFNTVKDLKIDIKIENEKKGEAVKLLLTGKNHKETTKILGINRTYLYSLFNKEEKTIINSLMEQIKTKKDQELAKKIKAFIDQGMKQPYVISKNLDISYYKITKIIKKFNIL